MPDMDWEKSLHGGPPENVALVDGGAVVGRTLREAGVRHLFAIERESDRRRRCVLDLATEFGQPRMQIASQLRGHIAWRGDHDALGLERLAVRKLDAEARWTADIGAADARDWCVETERW